MSDQFPRVDLDINLALSLNLIRLMCPNCGSLLEDEWGEGIWYCTGRDSDYNRFDDFSCSVEDSWITLNQQTSSQ